MCVCVCLLYHFSNTFSIQTNLFIARKSLILIHICCVFGASFSIYGFFSVSLNSFMLFRSFLMIFQNCFSFLLSKACFTFSFLSWWFVVFRCEERNCESLNEICKVLRIGILSWDKPDFLHKLASSYLFFGFKIEFLFLHFCHHRKRWPFK